VCTLLAVGALGCPHAFGRGGALDKAAHKDVKGNLEPGGDCSKQDYETFCGNGQEDSEECRQECG
jgi:hypothetical protein